MSNAVLPLKFISSPIKNGIGRYIGQLQRVTIKFCKEYGASKGVRDFIENDLLDFAHENPGVVIYLKPRRHRSPVLIAEFLNGERTWLCMHRFSREDVLKYVELYKGSSEFYEKKLRKMIRTDNPSIQGVWNPFTHKDPEISTLEFPDKIRYKYREPEPSATEQVLEIYRKQQLNK